MHKRHPLANILLKCERNVIGCSLFHTDSRRDLSYAFLKVIWGLQLYSVLSFLIYAIIRTTYIAAIIIASESEAHRVRSSAEWAIFL